MKDLLSEPEQSFFKCLEAVDTDNIWTLAIDKVVKSTDPELFRTLVKELKSQAKDNPPVMINILGQSCYDNLINL